MYNDDDDDDEKRMSDMIKGESAFIQNKKIGMIQEKTGRKTREEKTN